MTKHVLDTQEFSNLEELAHAIEYWRNLCNAEGHHESTVLAENAGRMSLVEETLTDGSKVLNLFIFPASDEGPLSA